LASNSSLATIELTNFECFKRLQAITLYFVHFNLSLTHRCTRFENPGSLRFLPNLWGGGGYIRVVELLGECSLFGGLCCIFINKFCEIFEGRFHSYPPSTPPLCASMLSLCKKTQFRFQIKFKSIRQKTATTTCLIIFFLLSPLKNFRIWSKC
jgi:hypothetical protein